MFLKVDVANIAEIVSLRRSRVNRGGDVVESVVESVVDIELKGEGWMEVSERNGGAVGK